MARTFVNPTLTFSLCA